MKKFLFFTFCVIVCIGSAYAAVRDENATDRQVSTSQQTQSSRNSGTKTATRTATIPRTTASNTNVTSRGATTQSNIISRNSATVVNNTTRATGTNASIARTGTLPRTNITSRNSTEVAQPVRTQATTISRAGIDQTASTGVTDTVTGAEYERCKSAYFTCMDQFCQLKNDDYRRCSCSDRVFELGEVRATMQDATNQLTVFTENLDVVGMTAAQATAMKTATEGENALTADTSASKALLQAIMNSIRGEDTSVSGKFSTLNSINLSFDTTNAFGTSDVGQLIATYDGQNLYSAVYPQCRQAVKADCTDAQLQRAVTAYLMAIEQDCNTVESALQQQQKEIKSAVRESSALLDLARVENRQKHNSDDIATCLNNVETAILSEEVCGEGYHKCLDNGEFIDISTGAPIAGVEKFYELGKLLTFVEGVNAADQKLSKIPSNRTFVQNFEKKVKKFAEPALDKCVEQADVVWEEYLDKAMLSIYYAQQAKVNQIKQGCFDFVSSCYMNGETALTDAMKELTGSDNDVVLQPDKVVLSTEMCRDYIESCNMMFYDQAGDIITDYINNRQDTDTLTACRAVVQQCFDKFGGTNYENFYYPYSGLFTTGTALKWFTLYEYDEEGNQLFEEPVSECAKQLKNISSCSSTEMMEKAFGGFDVITAAKGKTTANETVYYFDPDGSYNDTYGKYRKYGTLNTETTELDGGPSVTVLNHHVPRPTGVATEIYNQIVDILTTQCMNLQGRFVELQFIKENLYDESNLCISKFKDSLEYGGGSNLSPNLFALYAIGENENMCPRDYDMNVDTQSWGACLCWENGGRRSKFGLSPKCVAAIPVEETANDANCDNQTYTLWNNANSTPLISNWCTKTVTINNQVCPLNGSETSDNMCQTNDEILSNLPEGI